MTSSRRASHVLDLAEIEEWEKNALLGGACASHLPVGRPGRFGHAASGGDGHGHPRSWPQVAARPSELVRDGVTGASFALRLATWL